jgi:hypothetical protein
MGMPGKLEHRRFVGVDSLGPRVAVSLVLFLVIFEEGMRMQCNLKHRRFAGVDSLGRVACRRSLSYCSL